MNIAQLAYDANLLNPGRHIYEIDSAPTLHVLGCGALPFDEPIQGIFLADDHQDFPELVSEGMAMTTSLFSRQRPLVVSFVMSRRAMPSSTPPARLRS